MLEPEIKDLLERVARAEARCDALEEERDKARQEVAETYHRAYGLAQRLSRYQAEVLDLLRQIDDLRGTK